jgi:hypothetical protein
MFRIPDLSPEMSSLESEDKELSMEGKAGPTPSNNVNNNMKTECIKFFNDNN